MSMSRAESGSAGTEVRCGTWDELGPAAQAVRHQVFVVEQGIAQEDEWDAADRHAHHVVLYHGQQPVATGRLLRDPHGVEHIGRVAVLRARRGSGLGVQVMAALEQAARHRGAAEVRLHAQCTASGFYLRLGYRPVGEPFDEVGIAHVEMSKALAGKC